MRVIRLPQLSTKKKTKEIGNKKEKEKKKKKKSYHVEAPRPPFMPILITTVGCSLRYIYIYRKRKREVHILDAIPLYAWNPPRNGKKRERERERDQMSSRPSFYPRYSPRHSVNIPSLMT